MEGIEKNLSWTYKYLFEDLQNPITRKWYLVGNPYQLFFIITTYLLFCLKIGPMYMKGRQPYDLKNVMKVYNIVQVLISAHAVVEGIRRLVFYDFDFNCQPLSELGSEIFLWEARACYIYYIAKVTELLDTVFFVLRKSYRQLTFLHLFHHTLMVSVTWFGTAYYPGGHGIIMGFANSIVHVVMYSYYFLAGLGGKWKNILWWKKYVTIIQLVQFVIISVHSANSFLYDCGYPVFLKYMLLIYSNFFLYLFGKFYYRNYCKKESASNKYIPKDQITKNVKSH